MEEDTTSPVQTICRACDQPMALRPDGKLTKKGPILHVCQPRPIETREELVRLGFVDSLEPTDTRAALGLIRPMVDQHTKITRKVRPLALQEPTK